MSNAKLQKEYQDYLEKSQYEDYLNSQTPAEEGEDLSGFEKTLNVLDIVPSLARTGAEAAISPEREVLPELGKQFERIIESPTTAASYAPTGIDVNETFIKDVLGETEEQRAKVREEYPTAQKVISNVAGFVTENVLDPFTAVGMLPKVRRVVNAPLTSVADRQAAKALSKYAGKSDVLAEGKDIEIAAKRLVAEDLQGLLRSPEKLFEKISGTRKVDKIAPESLNTLTILKGPKEKGLIGEISEGVSSVINKVQDADPSLKNKTYPLDTVLSVVRSNIEKNADKLSGETLNIEKVGEILNSTLKPFDDITSGAKEISFVKKTPGSLELEEGIRLVQGTPKRKISTLSLSELQELRKNIGRLVSDRTFYAKADQNVKVEAEVLSEVYRELGKVIKANLEGKQVRLGKEVVDAGKFYEAQNNRMKQLMDVKSLLDFTPTKALKESDIPATILSMIAEGSTMGLTGFAGEALGVPYSSTVGLMGAGYKMAGTAGEKVKKSAPEYLSSIFATAAKVPPTVYPRGVIQYMREGKPVNEFGREPQSIIDPKELIKYRIPTSTKEILENKEIVLAKLAQNGISGDQLKMISESFDNEEDAANTMIFLYDQKPDLFKRSNYKIFDGKFVDPNDAAKAADKISRREDLNSIERAKMINKINKYEVPEGM